MSADLPLDERTAADPPVRPLGERDKMRLEAWRRRLPQACLHTGRRRRILLLALAAPGFLAVFTTPLHGNAFFLALGLIAFAAALLFRRCTEDLFRRAEATETWPHEAHPKETCHA